MQCMHRALQIPLWTDIRLQQTNLNLLCVCVLLLLMHMFVGDECVCVCVWCVRVCQGVNKTACLGALQQREEY